MHGGAKIAAEDAAIHPFLIRSNSQADLVNLAEAETVGPEHYIGEEAAVSAVGHIL